jgi:HEAT repeat protein
MANAMQIARRHLCLLTLSSWVVFWTAGCDTMPTWIPFQGPISDTLPGVVTPAERIAGLRKLLEDAPKATSEQKQLISNQLANSIREEKDPLIRTETIRVLGAYPSASADAILKAALNDADMQARIAACEAWGRHHDEQAVQLLATTMNGDADSDVRLAAAKALGETMNSAAAKPLGNALNDPDPAMQYRAVLSLKKVTGKDLGNDVNRWQQYLRGETPSQPSLAERLRQWF